MYQDISMKLKYMAIHKNFRQVIKRKLSVKKFLDMRF